MSDISPGPCGETTGALERCTQPAEFVISPSPHVDYGTRACGRHLLSVTRFLALDGYKRLTVHVLPEGRPVKRRPRS
jgi:hypothetical protein